MKRCSRCQNEKPLTEFYRSKQSKDGRDTKCKECDDERRRVRSNRDRAQWHESMRRGNYRRMYGITVDDYNAMLVAQKGCCAICKVDKPVGGYKHFSVDHDHRTGKVRGLLCNNCNRAIGCLQDDPALLQAAAEYLRSAQTSHLSLPL